MIKNNFCSNKNETKMSLLVVFDFTLRSEGRTPEDVITILSEIAQDWAFQKERGESGYEHYQGRLRLQEKKRLTTLKRIFDKCGYTDIHLSPTSTRSSKNFDYVMKEETRIDGPWTSQAEEEKGSQIPWDVAMIRNLYPYQQQIIDLSRVKELRRIHCVIDHEGCKGKTTITRYMMCHGLAQKLPFCNDYQELLEMVCCLRKDGNNVSTYVIDMPRAMPKDKLRQLYSAIEEIKGGYAYDRRFKFKQVMFDPPNIFVFTNEVPQVHLLSRDRWMLWKINDRMELIPYYDSVPLINTVQPTVVPNVGTSSKTVPDQFLESKG